MRTDPLFGCVKKRTIIDGIVSPTATRHYSPNQYEKSPNNELSLRTQTAKTWPKACTAKQAKKRGTNLCNPHIITCWQSLLADQARENLTTRSDLREHSNPICKHTQSTSNLLHRGLSRQTARQLVPPDQAHQQENHQ